MNQNDSPESGEPADSLRIPVHEEIVEARVTDRQIGSVRLTRHVDELPVEAVVPLRTDGIDVERREIDEFVTDTREPWYDGDTLVIPVYEERLVTEKRLVLKEELRVHRTAFTEELRITETVRKERIEIEIESSPD
jgi:uncharacterized protein (TIGR02271 family)